MLINNLQLQSSVIFMYLRKTILLRYLMLHTDVLLNIFGQLGTLLKALEYSAKSSMIGTKAA